MLQPAQSAAFLEFEDIEDLLGQVSKAFTAGSLAEGPAEEQRTRLEQKQHWMASLRYSELTRVPEGDRRLLAVAKVACDRARILSVKGDSLGACRQIAIAEVTTGKHLISQLARGLAATDVAAAEAAVLYQAGDLSSSQDRLFTSCRLDSELASEFGLTDLHVHRIHLLGKMVQLLAARKLFREAMEFGATAIVYVGGEAPPWWPLKEPWPTGDWDPAQARALPGALRSMLFQQLAIEIGAALLEAPSNEAVDALSTLTLQLPRSLETLCEDSLARAYLVCRRLAAYPHNLRERLRACAALLAHPRRDAETLWLLGALEAARCCAPLDQVTATEFRARVFVELSMHPSFPPRLRESWKRLSAQERDRISMLPEAAKFASK